MFGLKGCKTQLSVYTSSWGFAAVGRHVGAVIAPGLYEICISLYIYMYVLAWRVALLSWHKFQIVPAVPDASSDTFRHSEHDVLSIMARQPRQQ